MSPDSGGSIPCSTQSPPETLCRVLEVAPCQTRSSDEVLTCFASDPQCSAVAERANLNFAKPMRGRTPETQEYGGGVEGVPNWPNPWGAEKHRSFPQEKKSTYPRPLLRKMPFQDRGMFNTVCLDAMSSAIEGCATSEMHVRFAMPPCQFQGRSCTDGCWKALKHRRPCTLHAMVDVDKALFRKRRFCARERVPYPEVPCRQLSCIGERRVQSGRSTVADGEGKGIRSGCSNDAGQRLRAGRQCERDAGQPLVARGCAVFCVPLRSRLVGGRGERSEVGSAEHGVRECSQCEELCVVIPAVSARHACIPPP